MFLYHYPLSVNSQKTRLVLEEKKLDYTSKVVNVVKGHNLQESFMRLNHTGTVPVMKDSEFCLTDTITIVKYLNNFDTPLGGQSVDLAKMETWMERIQAWDHASFTYGHVGGTNVLAKLKTTAQKLMGENPAYAQAYKSKIDYLQGLEDKVKDHDYVTQTKRDLVAILDDAQEQLHQVGYIAGTSLSLADCCFIPILSRIEACKFAEELIAPRTDVNEYLKRMKTRRSMKAVVNPYKPASSKLDVTAYRLAGHDG